MRTDQYMGLTKKAKKIIERSIKVREIGKTIMPDKSEVAFDRVVDKLLATRTVCGKIVGAWVDEVAQLHRYTFGSGVVYEEYVQCTPWCGGPMYFIALRRVRKDGSAGKFLKTSLWSSKETQLREEHNNSAAD
ncbi:MAG: hypothetical protein KGS72_20280 [Cyanobacteria bacterium REEB67]|nr:hypothetical protein [Cyanobacteria bacterium REEB67]